MRKSFIRKNEKFGGSVINLKDILILIKNQREEKI
jgi:hypothetical protein